MSQVRPGLLIAIIVFAAFAAYAFLAPATYRTSALLVVDPASPASSAGLPEPLEAARRLSEASLDRVTLERLSRERAGSKEPSAVAQAASCVRQSLEIDTSDALSFSIVYRDSDAGRTARACNLLAKRALVVAPQVLADRNAVGASDLKRQQQTEDLAAFLAAHPQVASEAAPSGDKSPDKDPALSAFHAEKANLEKRILDLQNGVRSDNPYVDPRESNLTLLKRRLVEINTAVTARRTALDAKPSSTALSPELRAEWKRLVDDVTQPDSPADVPAPPALTARLVSQAGVPVSPIDPNRRLLLFFGLVFGVGFGTAFTLAVRAARQRRPRSTPPPVPSLTQAVALGAQLPTAPAPPTDVGPHVPVTPPPSYRAPPIVPMPQRPISSSPPAAGAGNHRDGSDGSSLVGGESKKPISSRPPGAPRPFASTLVLPPAENPSPINPVVASDPVLASANEAWEQQIRAHDVPGFAVVTPRSEPPPPTRSTSSVPPERIIETHVASSSPPAQRPASRPLNPMKVTQPLGSFVQESLWDERAPATQSEGLWSYSPPPSDSRYSYVSSMPPAPSTYPPRSPKRSPLPPRSPIPQKNVVSVQVAPGNWQPDPSLTPSVQRPLCEKLYPFAVESCFVLAVISTPESAAYKSRVAAEIALALAETGHPRILLLEGDLHRPSVQRVMRVDMPMTAGFSQQLNARGQGNGAALWTVVGCMKSLHILAEGIMRSPGLLLSRQFATCVKELRSYYDLIVIDGPMSSLTVDSGSLDAVTDGLVTVCPEKGSAAIAPMLDLFSKKRFSAFVTTP